MFYIWILLTILWVGALAWAVNGLYAVSRTARIMTAYLDWKYENFQYMDERTEPVDITGLFHEVNKRCQLHIDPFGAFSDQNRESFRVWFKENESRY